MPPSRPERSNTPARPVRRADTPTERALPMSDPRPPATDTDVADEAANRWIAAVLLVAILVVTFVAIAAGQAFAAQGGCGEPGHGDAVISQPRDSAFA